MIAIKRSYEEWSGNDGFRILIDRLWPRGVSKEKAHLDLWLKDIAPSTELRKWFAHDPAKWQEFRNRYFQELKEKEDLIKVIKDKLKEGSVTLVYSAKDEEHNDAVVLKEYLENNFI